MAERALIIAVERYDQVVDGFTAKELRGTLQSALKFRDWLLKKWKHENIGGTIYFCSDPQVPGHFRATSADIINALIKLEKEGVNTTDNLYVYFSGHGFRLAKAREPLSDVLVASDFIDTQRSGHCCFKLDALIDGLRGSLGHGCHFYFIDACRNEVPRAIASNVMPFGTDGDEDPSWFVLQSTVPGSPALVGGPFATKLRDGLSGAGKAKVWDPPIVDSMKVRFDSLRRYVKESLAQIQPITQQTKGEKGESDVILATISPIDPITLTIRIAGAMFDIKGTATLTPFDGAPEVHTLTGSTTALKLLPKHYKVRIEVDDSILDPGGDVQVEAYEDRELTFTISFLERVSLAPQTTPVQVSVPQGSEVVLRNVATGVEYSFVSPTVVDLAEGTYLSTLRNRDGPIIRRDELEIRPTAPTTAVSPAEWRGIVANESVAAEMPQAGGGVWLSETLGGPVADPDINVWLSIIGTGRIMGSRGEFSKIARLPLADFANEPPGSSPVYVLAGFASADVRLRVGINALNDPPAWQEATQPGSLRGVREVVARPGAGQHFVSFAIDDRPAYTVASDAMPDRGTVIVLSLDDEQIRIAQYLVPIGHLLNRLEPTVLSNFSRRAPLVDIYTLGQLTRAFRERRRIEAEFRDGQLESLLGTKWLDPIGGALAAYELARRRKSLSALNEVAANMERFFGALPDSAAISRLAGRADRQPTGVPLFLDGLRAFRSYREWLPYPAALLDYTGPWTAWRDAVVAPD